MTEAQGAAPVLHERLAGLDPHQQRAVFSDGPATLVQAQVGSGKTTVLVHKLLWLHLVQGVALRDVVVLTFTRRAADEIRARVRDVGLDSEGAWQLLGTFHSVARALLTRDLPVFELGFSPGFEVLDARGREDMLERLIDEHDLKVKYRARLSRRWEGWRRGQRRFGNMKRDDDMGRLVELFAIEKQRRGLMDFDDLLDNATRLLPLPAPPSWILIDELQDCGPEQFEFVERLCGPQTHLFAVGDPDQSIYSWRGGSPRLFRGFGIRRRARVLDLPRNYRSTATIVEGARALLGGRALQATRPEGERLAVVDHHDPQTETLYLAKRLGQLHAQGCPWDELALLVRTQQQLAPLAEGLVRGGIPCAVRGLGEGPAVRWLRGVLRAALTDDALEARAALTHDRYGLLATKHLRKARAWCEERSESGLAGLRAFLAAELERRTKRRRKKREAADQQMSDADLRAARDGADLRAALTWCARLAELPAWLEAHQDEAWDARFVEHLQLPLVLGPTRSTQPRDLAEVTRWLADLRVGCSVSELIADVTSVLSRSLSRGGVGPARREGAYPSPTKAADAVHLMTIHASKGLEFRHVFVCGANAGLLPLASAWRKRASLAEERRLFFVALTRARDSVELSWYRAPTRPDVRPEPSSFLSELPERCLVWLDAAGLAERSGEQAKTASDTWSVGERVQHKKYGPGAIVAVDGTRLRCDFPSHGEKQFSAALCPLQRLTHS